MALTSKIKTAILSGMDKTFTLAEVAKELNRTRQTAYNLYHAGEFPNAETNGAVRVPMSDVMALRQRLAEGFRAELEKLGYIVQIVDKRQLV